MRRRRFSAVTVACPVLALLLLAAGEARADQCSISTTSVSFGTYNVFSSAPTDSTGSVTYRCNGNTTGLWISLTRGQSPSFSPRTLRKGSEELGYNLYLDAARTTVWGDGSGGTQTGFDLSSEKKADVTLPIYGRIPAGQDVAAGNYTDSISVVINF
jgi:spore coat protein U-like protein